MLSPQDTAKDEHKAYEALLRETVQCVEALIEYQERELESDREETARLQGGSETAKREREVAEVEREMADMLKERKKITGEEGQSYLARFVQLNDDMAAMARVRSSSTIVFLIFSESTHTLDFYSW